MVEVDAAGAAFGAGAGFEEEATEEMDGLGFEGFDSLLGGEPGAGEGDATLDAATAGDQRER